MIFDSIYGPLFYLNLHSLKRFGQGYMEFKYKSLRCLFMYQIREIGKSYTVIKMDYWIFVNRHFLSY